MHRNQSFLIILSLFLAAGMSAYAEQTCVAVDQSEKEVLPGVFLKWDSSFLCADAPDADTYRIEVRVSSHAGSVEAVTIQQIVLSHITPRPRGQAPMGAKTGDSLPVDVAPGDEESFTVEGFYTLAQTDEGKKANHHYLAAGVGNDSGELFSLGINVHFRAPGVAAE